MKKEVYPKKMIEDYKLLLSAYPEHYKLRREVAEILRNRLVGKKNVKIIDIGCGKGETLEYILKLVPDAEVIAVDNDEIMINNLKISFEEYAKDGKLIPVCEDVFRYIPKLAAESLDGVTSSWTIHNFTREKRRELLLEIYRVLKPGGIFVNMDKYVFDDPKKDLVSLQKAVENLKLIPKKELADIAIKHEEDDRHPNIIMKMNESVAKMEKVGFKNIKFHSRVGRETVLSCLK